MAKIMMVLMGLDIGGAETHVLELSKELKNRGYEIEVVSAGGAFEKELIAAGIPCFYAPLNKRSIPLMIKSYAILKNLIKKEKPDIVHSHARIPSFICGLLHKNNNFRFVTSAHWVFYVNPLLKFLSNWGERTVAVSDDIRSYLKKNYGIEDSKITNTINGIDTNKFSAQADGSRIKKECGFEKSFPVISHVSRLDESRALACKKLVAIAPKLKEQYPGLGIVIAGDGDSFSEIKAAADKANSTAGEDFIRLLGARTDISEIVAAGDCFVGVSRAALEAMSEEKPVIIAGNEGYIGLYDESKVDICNKTNFCARQCPQLTEELLLDDITKLLSKSEDEKKALGLFGRETILKNFSVAKMASDCIWVYDKVTAEDASILVSGYYGYKNLGDDATLASIKEALDEKIEGYRLTVLSNKPEETKETFGVNAIYRFNPFSIISEMKKCTVFVSGGGSLLQDNTSTRSLVYYTALIKLANHYGKKILFYSNGIGPVNQAVNKTRVTRASELAEIICLRDEDSYRVLTDMGMKNQNVILASDSVFSMRNGDKEEGRKLLEEAGCSFDKPAVGISVRPVRGVNTDLKEFALFADKISENGFEPVFIVMQRPDDNTIIDEIIKLMKNKACKISSPYKPYTMMGAISLMDAVVSTRLHSIIFAAHEAVPVLGIEYDPKVSSILADLGMMSAGEYKNFSSENAFEAFSQMMNKKEEYKKQLIIKKQQEANLAALNNEALLKLIGK